MNGAEAEAAADLAETEREDRAAEARKSHILDEWEAQKTHMGVFIQGGIIAYEGNDSGGLRFILRASRISPAFLQVQLTPAEALAWGKAMLYAVDEYEGKTE